MTIAYKYFYWVVVVLALLWFSPQLYFLHYFKGFSWPTSIANGIANTLLTSLGLWVIIKLVQSYPIKVSLYTYSLLIALLIAVASVYANFHLIKWWCKYMEADGAFMHWYIRVVWVQFPLNWIFFSWIATNAALKKNIDVLNARFHQQTDAALLLKEAELFKLRQQLQPHFLYNSLNSISALIMISPDRAQEMIGKLSDFLRASVRRESEDLILLKDELLYIESYLAIESVRFGDRLKVIVSKNYQGDPKIPPFLFQPLLENAIKFGLYGNTGQVEINIQIMLNANMLMMTIANPYDETGNKVSHGTGFGLSGVGRRLYLLFARTDLLETEKDGKIFKTTLKIPQDVQSDHS